MRQKADKRSRIRLVAALIAVSVTGSASAEIVTVTFALEVETRQTGGYPIGEDDSAFVPFGSTATLSFDSTWDYGYTEYPTPDITMMVATFAGQNQFTSGLSELLPWGPPFPPSAYAEYDRTFYTHSSFEASGTEFNRLFWDKRHYYEDNSAMLEYRHGFVVQEYPDTYYPIAPNFQDFRTDDLMAFLFLLQAQQTPMQYDEYARIYDYQAQDTVEAVIYRGRATIIDIAAPSIVPVPAVGWLLAPAFGVIGWHRRRPSHA